MQLAEVNFSIASEIANVKLDVKIGIWEQSRILEKLVPGKSNFDIYIPDINKPTVAEFFLKTGGKILDYNKTEW